LFLSESPMKLAEPAKFHRKSGRAQWRDTQPGSAYLPVTVISTGSVCGGMQEFALQAW
jgi:hypothetical protein